MTAYACSSDRARSPKTPKEFDAGIIAREMERAGMSDALTLFEPIAKNGLCTMDPQIGRWVRESWGEDDDNKMMNALSLKEMIEKLLPECVGLLANHHAAGVDALLHRRLAYALCGLSRAPCRLMADGHDKKAFIEDGRDVAECTRCGERF